jgi:hypothetical protein
MATMVRPKAGGVSTPPFFLTAGIRAPRDMIKQRLQKFQHFSPMR